MNGRDFARQCALIDRRARNQEHRRKAMAHLVRRAGAVPVVRGGKTVGYRTPDGFMLCEKRRFRTRVAAQAELGAIRLFSQNVPHGRIPVRAYFCTYCQGWHLTSQPRQVMHNDAA